MKSVFPCSCLVFLVGALALASACTATLDLGSTAAFAPDASKLTLPSDAATDACANCDAEADAFGNEGRHWRAVSVGAIEGNNAIWANSNRDIWAGGANGNTMHWDGKVWRVEASHALTVIYGMRGFAENDVWAVGSGPQGSVMHWGGSTWAMVACEATTPLRGVWGLATNDLWTVGDQGAIAHWDGTRWTRTASGTTRTLYAVAGSAQGQVWAVGARGVVLHRDAAAWTAARSGVTDDLYGVWASNPAEVWAVGFHGVRVRWDGAQWNTHTPSNLGQTDLYALSGSAASDLWAVGEWGTIQHWNGSSWFNILGTRTSMTIRSVTTADGEAWAAGAQEDAHLGEIVHY